MTCRRASMGLRERGRDTTRTEGFDTSKHILDVYIDSRDVVGLVARHQRKNELLKKHKQK